MLIVLRRLSQIHNNIFTIFVVYEKNNMKKFHVSMTFFLFLSLTIAYNNGFLNKKVEDKLYQQLVSLEWEFWTKCTNPIPFLLDSWEAQPGILLCFILLILFLSIPPTCGKNKSHLSQLN